jgi:hypothetical protein
MPTMKMQKDNNTMLRANFSFVSALIVLAVFGTCFYCHAQTADEVLKKCQYLESQTSYSAVLENLLLPTNLSHGAKLIIEQKILGKQNGDGTKQSRVETTTSIQAPPALMNGRKTPQIPSIVLIIMANGETWSLDAAAKEATQVSFIKDTLKTANSGSAMQGDLTFLEGAKNELLEEPLDGQPCFKITQTLSREAIKKQLDMWKSPAFEAVNKNATQRIIAKKELWVRKSDYLVIETCMYDPDGNRISGIKYKSITIGLPLSADLFEIPEDYKKTTINSGRAFAEKIQSKVINPIRISDLPAQPASQKKRVVILLIFLTLMAVPICALIWFRKTKP